MALPRRHLIHLDQKQLLAGPLALTGVIGIGERESGYFAK